MEVPANVNPKEFEPQVAAYIEPPKPEQVSGFDLMSGKPMTLAEHNQKHNAPPGVPADFKRRV